MAEELIYKTINDVMKKISAVTKSRVNKDQNFAYRGIDDIMNELHPAMAECGLFVVPTVLSEQRAERKSQRGNALFFVRQNIKFTFYAQDGSHIESIVIGEAMDSGDKASNKALSVALKYALLQVFCIPTEDEKDPDAEAQEVKSNPQTENKVQTTVVQDLKGGPSTPGEKAQIMALLNTTNTDGTPIFENKEKIAFSKMRVDHTAMEVINLISAEISARRKSE